MIALESNRCDEEEIVVRRSNRKLTISGLLLIALSLAYWAAPVRSFDVPVHDDLLAPVPLLNAWTIWWNSHSASQGFHGYWNAPIFAPVEGTFAFSEPQPITLLIAPVIWLGGSPTLALNTYLFTTILANALTAACIVHHRLNSVVSSIVAAVLIATLPILMSHRHVCQLVPVWGMLWSWSALAACIERPTVRSAVSLASAIVATFLCSVHMGLFNGVVLAFAAPVCTWITAGTAQSQGRILGKLIACGVVTCIIVSAILLPLLIPMRNAILDNEFERSDRVVGQLSAQPTDYIRRPASIWSEERSSQGEAKLLCPGIALTVLTLAGLILGLKSRTAWPALLAVIAIVSLTLSFGKNLQLGEFSLWSSLTQYVPGFAQVRNVYRFAILSQVAFALLATYALSRSVSFCLRTRRTIAVPSVTIMCLFVITACLEQFPSQSLRAGTPQIANDDWTLALRERTPSDGIILCLPMGKSPNLDGYVNEARWMYYATAHRRKLANGYSGFFPESYQQLRNAIAEEPLDPSFWKSVFESGVRYLVVRKDEREKIKLVQPFKLKPLHDDPDGISVFQLLEN